MATRQVLFIQGAGDMHAPDGSGVLASYLRDALGDAAEVLVPDMTDAENPRYEAWSGQLRTELAGLRDRPVLVGHSLGGSVLLRCRPGRRVHQHRARVAARSHRGPPSARRRRDSHRHRKRAGPVLVR